MVNRERPHVYVLPEDKANGDMANGFMLQVSTRQIQVFNPAGGWLKVIDDFESGYVAHLHSHADCVMVLLIDFDGHHEDRLRDVKARVPLELADRVFVLGTLTRPEELKPSLGSYETIGKALAVDCHNNTDATWCYELLRHNADEIARMRPHVCPILF